MIKALIAALMLGAGPAPSIDIPPPSKTETPAKVKASEVAKRQASLRTELDLFEKNMKKAGIDGKVSGVLWSTQYESTVAVVLLLVNKQHVALLFTFNDVNNAWEIIPDEFTLTGAPISAAK